MYHKILQELGYRGNFGDILKRNPPEIEDTQKIWQLHKLRNTLVHEMISPKENLEKLSQEYRKTIEEFLQKITSKK
jgi:uncharacterized protein YutE (UPF0331/DUF86 family)